MKKLPWISGLPGKQRPFWSLFGLLFFPKTSGHISNHEKNLLPLGRKKIANKQFISLKIDGPRNVSINFLWFKYTFLIWIANSNFKKKNMNKNH